jgi:hypothetical protein
MVLELSFMGGSAAVMAALFVIDSFEKRKGVVPLTVQTVREKADPILEGAHEKTKTFLSYINWRTAIYFVQNIFVYGGKFFMHLANVMHDASERLVEKASRRKENLSKGGAASFYMKSIKEAKDQASIATRDGADTSRGDKLGE